MRDPEKVKKEMEEKDRKILETAFRIFVEKKIEPVSMGEIAKEAGVGRATVFRHYQNKLELVIAVCTAQWQAYFDKLDEERPLSSIADVPAIERFIFTLDSYIDMYQNHKDLLRYNDIPDRYSGRRVFSCDSSFHDGNMCSLCRGIYLGGGGQ